MRVGCVEFELRNQPEAADNVVVWNCSWTKEGYVAEGLCPLAMFTLHVYPYD